MNRSVLWRVQLGVLSDDRSIHEFSINAAVGRYEALLERYPLTEDEPPDKSPPPDETALSSDLDPLTAMVVAEEKKSHRLQEMDLKYRKEKARMKRGLTSTDARVVEDEDYDEAQVALQIIDKDLDRLAPPIDKDGKGTSMFAVEARHLILRQALYVFQNEHPDIGYRQGMHEVASYILFALELDYHSSVLPNQSSALALGAQLHSILEPVLVALQEAYDVPKPGSNQKPLEAISLRVLRTVQTYDARLGQFLRDLPCPPQLYLTKWMRLLYAREVQDVIRAMDAWIQWQRDFGGSLLHVLEAAAAARLLIHRHEIMGVDHDALHFLMNVPVETDIGYFLHITSKVLQRDMDVDLPPVLIPAEEVLPVAAEAPEPQRYGFGGSFPHLQSLRSTLEQKTKSIGSTLEEKTKSFGKRLAHEWEQVSAPTDGNISSAALPPSPPHESSLNVSYRPVSVQTHPVQPPRQQPQQFPEDARDSIRTLQAYLIAQQRGGAAVPQQVWQALSHLDFVVGQK